MAPFPLLRDQENSATVVLTVIFENCLCDAWSRLFQELNHQDSCALICLLIGYRCLNCSKKSGTGCNSVILWCNIDESFHFLVNFYPGILIMVYQLCTRHLVHDVYFVKFSLLLTNKVVANIFLIRLQRIWILVCYGSAESRSAQTPFALLL